MIVGLGIAVAGATAAMGWALTHSARNTVAVECQIHGSSAIIPATSGNPVTDCAAEWQRLTGHRAPPLVAYNNGHGGITVARAKKSPAPAASPLPPGKTQNLRLIELQESLDDMVAGLPSGC